MKHERSAVSGGSRNALSDNDSWAPFLPLTLRSHALLSRSSPLDETDAMAKGIGKDNGIAVENARIFMQLVGLIIFFKLPSVPWFPRAKKLKLKIIIIIFVAPGSEDLEGCLY